ncbi:protein ninH [Enterobacteriaceae bacterium BIT-l23]|uniref:protein ninH n=1 Tax=Jejubacter sp. L23 TaxID=3092086 RepID=UPI0015852118|nr:protein ninH [Enterobacteriaceae bacterium BIT-l23]
MRQFTTIPELLISTRGSMKAVAERLGCDRATVRKYARDREAQSHAVVNGKLMAVFGKRGKHRHESEAV